MIVFVWCNAWLNSIGNLTPPATSRTCLALRARGWGIVWSSVVPGVPGWGKSKETFRCSCTLSTPLLDFLNMEKIACFPEKNLEFVTDSRQEWYLKFKSCSLHCVEYKLFSSLNLYQHLVRLIWSPRFNLGLNGFNRPYAVKLMHGYQ